MADIDRTQTTEVRQETVAHATKPSGAVLAKRIVYYIGGALLILLAVRFVLALLGANRLNPFADFVFGLSEPFARPFFSLFTYEPVYGQFSLELGTLVAIAVYAAIMVGIGRLLTLNRPDPSVR